MRRADIGINLRDHRIGIWQQWATRDVLVPGIRDRKDLHVRDHSVGVVRVKQNRIGDHGNRAENAAFLVDALGARGRDGEENQGDEFQKRFHNLPVLVSRLLAEMEPAQMP